VIKRKGSVERYSTGGEPASEKGDFWERKVLHGADQKREKHGERAPKGSEWHYFTARRRKRPFFRGCRKATKSFLKKWKKGKGHDALRGKWDETPDRKEGT